jgi:hypothetical protein
MDVAEFHRLALRVTKARNLELRAFREAYVLAPGTVPEWPEQTSAAWVLWRSANNALRAAVADFEALINL